MTGPDNIREKEKKKKKPTSRVHGLASRLWPPTDSEEAELKYNETVGATLKVGGSRGNTKRARGSGLHDYLKYIQEQSGPHFHKWNCSSFRAIFKKSVASRRDGLGET